MNMDTLINGFLKNRNRIFWALFLLTGAFILLLGIRSILYLDLILAVILVMLGLHKLGEELNERFMEKAQKKMSDSMDYLTKWLQSNESLAKTLEEKNESRFFNSDRRRIEIDDKLETKYRGLVRKILELETKLNQAAMSFARGEEIRSGREKSKEAGTEQIRKEHEEMKRWIEMLDSRVNLLAKPRQKRGRKSGKKHL